jgi:phosphomannomutase/phosphoglucomutase
MVAVASTEPEISAWHSAGAVRLFGTNGIREVVGQRLTPAFVESVAAAIGQCFPVGPPIAVGWDGRTTSPAIVRIVSGTLALSGHRVLELGLLPTPAIQYSVPRVGAQLGVIVTASHNPPEFNGIKCIASDGLEVTRDVEERIEAAVEGGSGRFVPYDATGEVHSDSLGASRYVEGILERVDRAAIARRKFTVVLDCANGASVVTSPELLRRLGCRVTTLNGHIDGTFPGRRSEPTEANLADLRRTVPAVGADLGIAHDGDADRAVFVDAEGRFVPGEKVLALLARDRARRRPGAVVVVPVSSTQAVDDVVRPLSGEAVYTRVGSPAVTREMQRRSAVFGGEDNGGYVFPEFQLARDGAMTAAAILDYLARVHLTIAEAIRDLPDYTVARRQVPCPTDMRRQVLGALSEELGASGDRVDTTDGLKVFRGGGWVLLRPSGTEPLMRVVAEARDPAAANALADDGVRRLQAALRSLGVRDA